MYVFSLKASMVLTAVISSQYFGFEFTLVLICTVLIIVAAIYFYYREKILEGFKLDRDLRI